MNAHAEIIGKGSMGQVMRIGDTVCKKASKSEISIYDLLQGKSGICPGFYDSSRDLIVTPFYPTVLSIDTVPKDQRQVYSKVIESNLSRINLAISYLIATGYEYSDPLQWGLDDSGWMHLLDFSNGNNNFPSDVVRNNLFELSRFYEQFGLTEISKYVSVTSEVLTNVISRCDNPFLFEFFGDVFDGVDYRSIDNDLNSQKPRYAYYTTLIGLPINFTHASHTDLELGVKVILSLEPFFAFPDSIMDTGILTLVYSQF
ncbi:hypothetical protein [Methylomonas sp. AM2-LC]|uniref:hypothetical protein n=1 Tax=Methylomonas sp. AM2-LC TaxID=3153301 RepID=UPI0032635E01